MTEQERLEAGAVAAWQSRYGSTPRLGAHDFYEGATGVFSREGWAWRMALAVLHDDPLPRLSGDEWDYQEIARHVRKAMV